MLENLTVAQEFSMVVISAPQPTKIRLRGYYSQLYTIGAALIDLLLEGQLRLTSQARLEPTGLPAKDSGEAALLEIVQAARRPKTMKGWITYFMNRSGKKAAIFKALIQPLLLNGLVRQENYKICWFFPAKRYIADFSGKDRIVQRMRAELLEDGPVSLETSALVMLLEAIKLLKHFFSDYEQQQLKVKLARLQAEQQAEWQVIVQIKQAIDEMAAAVSVASIASVSAGS
jgi:hypothetical protein